MILGKRKSIHAIAPPRKKRKEASAIEEISFDVKAREDYLTGFHKRKLLRVKHAKEEAAKKDREAKLTARKILREGRKADLEKHVKAVDTLIKKANAAPDPSEQGDEGDEGEEEQWHGIEDNHDPPVNHEDEYMDDDKFTTVTVEAVDVSRDGLRKAVQDEENEIEASGQDKPDTDPQGDNAVRGRAGSEKGKRIWTKEPPSGLKKKQKKFRYESKAERKATRHREKSGNSAKARARKER